MHASRRDLLIAASLQAALVTHAGYSLAQTDKPGTPAPEQLKLLIAELKFFSAQDFPNAFQSLWRSRVETALATVEQTATKKLEDVISAVAAQLVKENPERLPIEIANNVIQTSVSFINIIVATSTDLKNGAVHIVEDAIERALACPPHTFGLCR